MDSNKQTNILRRILFYILCLVFVIGIIVIVLIGKKIRALQENKLDTFLSSTIPTELLIPANTEAVIKTLKLTPSLSPTQLPNASIEETSPTQISAPDESYNESALGAQMLALVNQSRAEEGLSPVEWDAFAASVAKAHVQDMAVNQYFSHWDLQGYGPDIRYALAGGTDLVMENLSTYYEYYSNNTPKQLENFDQLVIEAHEGLMNSPSHRKNIMDPHHTHVGIGFAYNPETGYFFVAQEFLNRYIMMDAVADSGSAGQVVNFSGTLLSNASDPLLNIAYEPFPSPMSQEMLNQTSTYSSAAVFLEAFNPSTMTESSFSFQFTLGNDPGFYHVRIWVDLAGEMVQVINDIIVVN
jgi:uncharacterized protein YkwD